NGCPMPRFQAALGIVSPAKANDLKATKHETSRAAGIKRAEIFTRSSDLGRSHEKNDILHSAIWNTSSTKGTPSVRHPVIRTYVLQPLWCYSLRSFDRSGSSGTHYNRLIPS